MRCTTVLLGAALVIVGCGGTTSSAAPASNGPDRADERAEPETMVAPPSTPEGQPLSVECAAYIAHYRRCEPVLAPSIESGDLRSADAEEAWIRFMLGSPESPGVPTVCRDADATLNASCP